MSVVVIICIVIMMCVRLRLLGGTVELDGARRFRLVDADEQRIQVLIEREVAPP